METAVEYHSRCIECLVSLSNNEEAVYDENLLATSIILRFYEEVDGTITSHWSKICILIVNNSTTERRRLRDEGKGDPALHQCTSRSRR